MTSRRALQILLKKLKPFLLVTSLTTGAAALIGVLLVTSSTYGQNAASRNTAVLVVERSAVGQKLGQDLANNHAAGPKNFSGIIGDPSVQQTSEPFADDPASPRYFITDLGTLGGTESFAYAVNDFGEVVGESRTAGDGSTHAFLYRNGKMTDLSPLNSQDVQTVGPTSINNAGQIASGLIVNGVYVPAIFNSATGAMTLIGSFGGVTPYGFNGVATSINNNGTAVGYSYIDSINRHAFLHGGNIITDIGSFGGYSAASSINDRGVIVGFSSNQYNGVANAFVYSDGVMKNIHSSSESYANDINNQGQAVGQFLTSDQSAFHAFLYSRGAFIDLGLEGSANTDALAINDLGQIVGVANVMNKWYGVLYQNGKAIEISTLIPRDFRWQLTWALDINNRGQIVGYGVLNGSFRAFLLTPAISADQCKESGWRGFGFKNQGQCIQFVNTGK